LGVIAREFLKLVMEDNSDFLDRIPPLLRDKHIEYCELESAFLRSISQRVSL
jgi:hypothetical protein